MLYKISGESWEKNLFLGKKMNELVYTEKLFFAYFQNNKWHKKTIPDDNSKL